MSRAAFRSSRWIFLASVTFLIVAAIAAPALTVRALAPSEEGEDATAIVDAARAVLRSFDATLRAKAVFPVDGAERTNWHFVPRGRLGVSLCELGPREDKLVTDLLRASLSEVGAKRAELVRELEGILQEIEGEGRRFPRDPELYFVSFFGEPSMSDPWGWRFEGHHLSLNFSLEGSKLVSATPAFYGANPAEVRQGPRKGLRVLGSLEDVARDLVRSLEPEQLEAAKKGEPAEVESATEARYTSSLPRGLSASRLSEEQRGKLEKLLDEYTAIFRPGFRERFRKELVAGGYDDIELVWSGGTNPGEKHSYMVHGPSFVIAYANFQNDANHIHASLRLREKDWPAAIGK